MRRFALSGSLALMAVSALNAQRPQAESFTWAGNLEDGGRVHVRNVRGSIVVQHVDGDRVSVTADKRWMRSVGGSVRIETRRVGDDLVICALWTPQSSCTPLEPSAGVRSTRAGGDVTVDFVIRVPKGAPVRVLMLNGNVSVLGATNDVEAQSVNGDVSVRTAAGSVYAGTVNGGVTAVLLAAFDADIDLFSTFGRLRSDFAIEVRERLEPQRIRGRIGRGGRTVRLVTINGSIALLRGG
jgi:hypothetical protein